MKTKLHIFILGIFLFIGIGAQAQGLAVANDRPEAIAKEKASEICDQLNLTGDQERALFRAYVKREVGIKKHVADKDPNSPAVVQQKAKLDNELSKAVEKELTPEQFQEWKTKFLKSE